jgi:hypothetical protein
MELELKYIVGYLPYDLKIKIRPFKGFEILSCLNLYINLGSIIPVLKPLSDLTKEIEVNGEKFIPIQKLNDCPEIKYYLNNWNGHDVLLGDFENGYNVLENKSAILKLYEWHFDIHELIENGLAIDMNTLPETQNNK